jgi:uncharacterized membrane protein YfcA
LAVALVAFGLFTGVASGLLGVGGGVFMVPFLVFATTLDQRSAQATSLCVVLPTAIVASVTLQRKGVGELRSALAMGALGAAGAVGGALLALSLPAAVLRTIFAAFLGLIGLRLLADALRRRPREPPTGE